MQTSDLIATYVHEVDAVTIVLCLTLIVIIKNALYFSKDEKSRHMEFCVHAVLVAAVSNILFFVVCKHWPEKIRLVYLFRDLYHGLVLLCLYKFLDYLRALLKLNSKRVDTVHGFTAIIFAVGYWFDIIAPLTHFGFYYDGEKWSDATLLKPYTLVYVYVLSMCGYMLIRYGYRTIKAVRRILVIAELVAVFILVMQSLNASNTFTCFTYIYPIIIVVILLHSRPYDTETGAVSEKAYASYLETIKKKNLTVDYMCLKLDVSKGIQISEDMGFALYSFWQAFFKEALFFKTMDDVFILAIPENAANGETVSKIEQLVYEVFPKYYEKYKITFRIACFVGVDFIDSSTELKEMVNYAFTQINENQTKVLKDKQIDYFKLLCDIRRELADIAYSTDLDDERVQVYCQPIKDVKTGKYTTAESLMRMKFGDIEMIYPDMFIPIAEGFGYIHTLSMIILNKVCKIARNLMEEGYEFERISVNFSVLEMSNDNFCEEVLEVIKKNRIPFEKIGFELTESQNDATFQSVSEKIKVLKSAGIPVYLDDFGTGYSNFDRILSLGLDVIKFDRSLLMCADSDKNVLFTLKHFSKAFKELKYKILFEGVENEKQEKLCIDCDADYLQGYKYSKPVPIERIREFFEKK